MPTTLTSRQQLALGLLLALTMILSRPHTISSLHHLPGTSWAVFFLGGLFIRQVWFFCAFCGLAAAIDYAAITFGSVSSFCVTPAYAMLLPCFGTLWLGGRWYARGHRDSFATLPRLTLAVVASAFIAELFSSGGFYFLGGRYTEPTLAEFLPRLAKYFPGMLGAMTLYVGVAAVAYVAWAMTRRRDAEGPRTLSPWLHK